MTEQSVPSPVSSRSCSLPLLLTVSMALSSGSTSAASDDLTPAQRQQIDSLALQLPHEVTRKRKRDSFGDLKSWLAQRAPLPKAEEARRVQQTHEQILAEHRVVPCPTFVTDILEELVTSLPDRMHPEAGRFDVTVIDSPNHVSASAGQHRLYISTATLRTVDGDRDHMAFLLAQQIGSSVLGYNRRWHQAQWAAELARRERVEQAVSGLLNGHSENPVLDRRRTFHETCLEDLFALHLCRLAGLDVARVLDTVRQEVVAAADSQSISVDAAGAAEIPLRRLRRLLMELRGEVSEEGCGLHEFVEGDWRPVVAGGLRQTDRAVVLVHGLGADLETFDNMAQELQEGSPDSPAILGLRYPNTGSLYRSSRFLLAELTRTGAVTGEFDFVCHSAGGLVFRRAAEHQGLAFRSATLIGTPHAGSDLSRLRPLVEAREFFASLRGTFSKPLVDLIADDSAQMVRDLEPDSLFLTELNAPCRPGIRDRYRIARGRALNTRKSLLLMAGVGAARTAIRKSSARKMSGHRAAAAQRVADQLRLPEEVRRGDLAVSLTSATTQQAASVLTVRATHSKLVEDPTVIEFVRAAIQH